MRPVEIFVAGLKSTNWINHIPEFRGNDIRCPNERLTYFLVKIFVQLPIGVWVAELLTGELCTELW